MSTGVTVADAPEISVNDAPEVTRKKGGVDKVVFRRSITCYCAECDRSFSSTGPAWSHTRSTRHPVSVEYVAEFAFKAAEVAE